MQLFTFYLSPNPLKVRLALEELELPYEPVEINLFKGEQHQDSFTRINNAKKVPVLKEGDTLLRESNAILAYLGMEYGGPLWPQTPNEQALALQWLFFESSSLAQHCGNWWWNDVIVPRIGKPELGVNDEVLKESAEDLQSALTVVENHLGQREYFMGEEFTLVDCSLGATLNLLVPTKIPGGLGPYPKTEQYCARIRERESWGKTKAAAVYGQNIL